MGTLLQDLKFGIRVLGKSPGFATAAIAVLALGIGANTAIFNVVKAVLIQPLPFDQPDRLVQIWHVPPQKSFPGMKEFTVSPANYFDWHAQNHVFEGMAIYTYTRFNVTGLQQPESVLAQTVEPSYLPLLGSQPRYGRGFLPDEDQPGHDHVVILTHGFWKSRFGGDPGVVGRQITLNGQPYSVVGILDARFVLPFSSTQVLTPLTLTDKQRAVRGEHHYLVVARLKSGIDLPQAQAEMSTISRRLEQQYPEDDKDWGAVVVPLREQLVGDVRPALLVLLGAVAFVLLIACANVANLVLARTLARQKEIAIRSALGASRWRVLQQVLGENVLLSLAGGAIGLYISHLGVGLLVAFFGERLPRTGEITLDGWVLAFSFVISVLTGIISGLVPAWRLIKVDVNEALKQGLGRAGSDKGGDRARKVLVAVEVALSLVLLIGAGLMIRSLRLLYQVDPGVDPHNVLTMGPAIAQDRFSGPLQQSQFYDEVLRRIRALPGVEAAGAIDDLPLRGGSNQPIAIEGRPAMQISEQPEVSVRVITPGYMNALHIPLKQGRLFTEADAADKPPVVLISESMARHFWPNENPVGKRLTLSFFPDHVREIVGVVGDVKQDALDQTQADNTLYWPLAQVSLPVFGGTRAEWQSYSMDLVVRGAADSPVSVPAVTAAIHSLDSDLPLRNIKSMQDLVDESVSQQRFNMLLLGIFAGLAMFLAAIGIYSVLAYSVRRRVREIGIRIALGARIGDILRLVVFDGMKPAIFGVGVGLVGALALSRVLARLIYGVHATDPLTFVAVSILLTAVALLASVVPAWRASRVQPVNTLRDE